MRFWGMREWTWAQNLSFIYILICDKRTKNYEDVMICSCHLVLDVQHCFFFCRPWNICDNNTLYTILYFKIQQLKEL